MVAKLLLAVVWVAAIALGAVGFFSLEERDSLLSKAVSLQAEISALKQERRVLLATLTVASPSAPQGLFRAAPEPHLAEAVACVVNP